MNDLFKPLQGLWRALPFVDSANPLVTVIELSGVIGAPGRKTINYAKLEKTIEAAFKPKDLAAVALAINSPGGSPVQSKLIYGAIRRQAKEKGVPVLSFIEDVGASGGYMLAVAGDEIYADSCSIVGSIGVISAGFGFEQAISKIGVSRRVHTAGDNKSQLDPFTPEDPEDVARLENILNEIHEDFRQLVRERRGDKADAHGDTMSGAFWAAKGAKERGLIDGTAHLGDFLRTRYGKDVRIKRLSRPGGSLLSRLLGGETTAPHVSPEAGRHYVGEMAALIDPAEILSTLEERALWSRFGR